MYSHKVAEAVDFHIQIIPDRLVDLISEEVKNMNDDRFVDAKVKGYDDLEKVRISKINWLGENHWISGIFTHYIRMSNKKIWEYDIKNLEDIQVTRYDKNGHYNWHSDYGTSTNPFFTRKLSASLLITDPSEYEGGDLFFIDYHGRSVKAPKNRGTMIIFDSRIPHKVSRVTRGTRTSLVTWMYGPKLK